MLKYLEQSTRPLWIPGLVQLEKPVHLTEFERKMEVWWEETGNREAVANPTGHREDPRGQPTKAKASGAFF